MITVAMITDTDKVRWIERAMSSRYFPNKSMVAIKTGADGICILVGGETYDCKPTLSEALDSAVTGLREQFISLNESLDKSILSIQKDRQELRELIGEAPQ